MKIFSVQTAQGLRIKPRSFSEVEAKNDKMFLKFLTPMIGIKNDVVLFEKVVDSIESIRNLSAEHSVVFDRKINKIIQSSGDSSGMDLPGVELKDKIFLHNHPSSFILSQSDIGTFLESDMLLMYSSTPGGGFSAIAKSASKSKTAKEKVMEYFKKNVSDMLEKFGADLSLRTISDAQYAKEFNKTANKIYRAFSKKFGFKYLFKSDKKYVDLTGEDFQAKLMSKLGIKSKKQLRKLFA